MEPSGPKQPEPDHLEHQLQPVAINSGAVPQEQLALPNLYVFGTDVSLSTFLKLFQLEMSPTEAAPSENEPIESVPCQVQSKQEQNDQSEPTCSKRMKVKEEPAQPGPVVPRQLQEMGKIYVPLDFIIENTGCPYYPQMRSIAQVKLRQLSTNVQQPEEPNQIPTLYELVLKLLSTLNPISSSNCVQAMIAAHSDKLFKDVPQDCFDAMHKQVNLGTMYALSKSLPDISQFKAHFETKDHLTINMCTKGAPSKWNEGHLFLTEDLKEYNRGYGRQYEYIEVRNIEAAIDVFKDLGSWCTKLVSLTVLFDEPRHEANAGPLRHLFAHMPLSGLVQFSFIRSTQIVHTPNWYETDYVAQLYSQFEEYLTAEKMPKLRNLTIWLNHEYKADIAFVALEQEPNLNLSSIIPQLECLTFVGPCANKRQFLAQLGAATKLIHLTLDLSRAFDSPPIDQFGNLVDMKKHFEDHLPLTVRENVTHLGLYRVNFRCVDEDPTELILLFPNLKSLHVHSLRYKAENRPNVDSLQFFKLNNSTRMTELRLHNFQMNVLLGTMSIYPSVEKLTLCDAKFIDVWTNFTKYYPGVDNALLLTRFFGQFPSLRELIIFTVDPKKRSAFMKQQFFDDIKRECKLLERVTICVNAFELGDGEKYDANIVHLTLNV